MKKNYFIFINSEKGEVEVRQHTSEKLELEDYYLIIGCERIEYYQDSFEKEPNERDFFYDVWCDEDGFKQKENAFTFEATYKQWVYGSAIVTMTDEETGETKLFTEEVATRVVGFIKELGITFK